MNTQRKKRPLKCVSRYYLYESILYGSSALKFSRYYRHRQEQQEARLKLQAIARDGES